jgi:hypothetical protein
MRAVAITPPGHDGFAEFIVQSKTLFFCAFFDCVDRAKNTAAASIAVLAG